MKKRIYPDNNHSSGNKCVSVTRCKRICMKQDIWSTMALTYLHCLIV